MTDAAKLAAPKETALIDQYHREAIERALDTTMLVEAAAGTGKTTSMIKRMIGLIRVNKCTIDQMAAVTFTRKAAAELRSRFQVALEQAKLQASDPDARGALEAAITQINRCFIGTIHSFCARLLRERPVEAGVDLAFEELDDERDRELRQEAWHEYVARLHASGDPLLRELDDLGLEIGQLSNAFHEFAQYPDVKHWPADRVKMPDLELASARLRQYAARMSEISTAFGEPGQDKLMPLYRRIPRMVRQADLARTSEIMQILALCREFDNRNLIQKNWPGGKSQALAELAQWNDFASNVAKPLVTMWLAKRYEAVLRSMRPAIKVYDRRRSQAGGLNFQDLLMRAAALLRKDSSIRSYFHARFTHLLVDEFQDTDPIQAEVMLLLTAEDPAQDVWKRCRPRPGSLFVVGDPKQSIYRFRRADIATYNQVKKIIEESGGEVVSLTSNFRTIGPVIDWINQTFEGVFPAQANEYSPARAPLDVVHSDVPEADLAGIRVLNVPAAYADNPEALAYETEAVACAIQRAIESRTTVPRISKDRSQKPSATGADTSDFMIVTHGKKNLAAYGRKLQELGISHQITGGAALNEVEELALLHTCLRSVTDPDNAVALLAALRSGLFGISDPVLYAFKQAGGRFSLAAPIPAGLDPHDAALLQHAFGSLLRYESWLKQYPPLPAFERIASDLGLMVRACASEGGEVRAGSFAKAFELLRKAQAEHATISDLVRYLGRLVEQEEKHDGLSIRPSEQEPVRVMNLHKVKGLEAPVVFLADPTGDTEHDVLLHVDREKEEPEGYLCVLEGGGRSRRILAKHEEWDHLAEVEKRFLDAEKDRLYYVAATRAGCHLVITRRAKNDHRNPWKYFGDGVEGLPELPIQEPQMPTIRQSREVTHDEVREAMKGIVERRSRIQQPSYETIGAKAAALEDAEIIPTKSAHGTVWGTLIHLLLETVMERPNADITALAEKHLHEQGLEPEKAGDAVAMVQKVTRSEIWTRACDSSRRLIEVPFHRLARAARKGGDLAQRVTRGVIDLVFQEPAGWVILDYKTHAVEEKSLQYLVEHYGLQVKSYAEAWHEITGEPVHEAGLYFIHADRYVPIKTDA